MVAKFARCDLRGYATAFDYCFDDLWSETCAYWTSMKRRVRYGSVEHCEVAVREKVLEPKTIADRER